MVVGQKALGGELMRKDTDRTVRVDLSDKVAVVVGGTGSIGREILLSLNNAGAKVIAASRNPFSERLKGAIEVIDFIPVDVTSEESVKEFYQEVVNRFCKVDILVLAQGIQLRKSFSDFTLDEWNTVINVNLTGTFLVCKYFSKVMVEKRSGKIVGITSLTSEFGIKNVSAYTASKGGMNQFLKTIAIELAGFGINVNMIAPGRIETNMTRDLIKAKKKSTLDRIPLGRFGLPSDLTGAVIFLVSDSANYMVGQTIIIDGGWLASGGNPEG